MKIRGTIPLFLLCLIGWVNKDQLITEHVTFIIVLIILLIAKHYKEIFFKKKIIIYIFLSIFILYYTVTTKNQYIDKDITKILFEINKDRIKSIDDKTKSIYYKQIIDNVSNDYNALNHTYFSINIEIDRAINNGDILASHIINYSLNFLSCPLLPSSVSLNKKISNSVLHTILVLLFAYLVLLEIKNKKMILKFFLILSVSSLILASIGIYLRFLYLNAHSDFLGKDLGLWNPPEPRIFFSSFSYKNHWSAYAILIISMIYTMISNSINKSRLGLLRNNSLISLILVSIIIIFSVFYSNSNSGILLIIFYTIFSFFLQNRNKLNINKIFVILACSLLVTLFLIPQTDLVERISNFLNGSSFRLYLWNDILTQIQNKTFWGYGVNSYKTINGIFQSTDVTSARQLNLVNAHQLYIPLTLHAHSDFLQTTSEIGFFGLCLIVFPIFFLVLRNLLLFSENAFPLISLALIFILVYSIVDFPFRNIAVSIMFLFLLMLCESRFSSVIHNS